MRRLVAVGLIALAVAVVTGVLLIRTHGSSTAQSPDRSPRAGAADPQTLVHLWPGRLASPRLAGLAADDTRRLLSTPWTLLGADGRDLLISFETGSSNCAADRGAYVRETSETVVIGHYVRDDGRGRLCLSNLLMGRGVVRLERPLG
jgi:hypothetical protein